jgi:hypothetical protein
MVETTLDIRISADDEASVIVETKAAGETARQAELLSFAQYVARTLNVLPRERALELAHALGSPEELERQAVGTSSVRVVARYLNARRGPRSFLRVKAQGDSPERALHAVLERDEALGRSAALMGTLASKGRLSRENEFAAALASADVTWDGRGVDAAADLHCPACGSGGPFAAVIWPSESAAICKCKACGAGIWLRRRHRPRLLPRRTWDEVESLRAVLTDGADTSLLDELRRAFVENRWPFAEVQGAPVLVSELAGPEGSWKFYAQAVDEQSLVLLYSICPLRVPSDRRREIADYITRANYGLAAGNFELDFEDGELRYKTALHVHPEGLDSRLLKRVVRANGLAMETYLAGVGAVIDGTSGSAATGIENQVLEE